MFFKSKELPKPGMIMYEVSEHGRINEWLVSDIIVNGRDKSIKLTSMDKTSFLVIEACMLGKTFFKEYQEALERLYA
ncbi:hypothetical protein [Butyrivibrio hungatei]|uniref:Uncharacterized protein n=1 Tax=Butyrivibrio hungatei TaxID=185008 RepID=A0A1D9P5L6_9FIRM|nr:hypothetical protein [Butyrivibrio hungatei]AOZ97916.1 hypothetical protein bhn_II117 [Butyrivibrio hungatei]